jgi:hypothetical protein
VNLMKKLLLALFLLASVPAFAQTAQQDMIRFVAFYDQQARAAGFEPDEHTSRDQRVAFLQQTVKRFCHPHLAMKRASPTRPISDEAVVWVRPSTPGNINPEYRQFWDFIRSGGSSAWQLLGTSGDLGHGEHLPIDQPLVNPLNLGELAEPLPGGKVPTVPGCTGPVPAPTPTPPVVTPVYPGYPGDEVFDAIAITLFADYAAAGQSPNAGMGRWFGRTVYDWLVGNTKTLDESIAKHRAEWLAILPRPQ